MYAEAVSVLFGLGESAHASVVGGEADDGKVVGGEADGREVDDGEIASSWDDEPKESNRIIPFPVA